MARQRSERTSLLIEEPSLQVLPTLATAIGLNEALFLQQMHYWIQKSEHHRDGRTWVYNTYEQWHRQLPFWSERTIRRIVGELERRGLLLSTTQYNYKRVDQTKWYTIDYPALVRLEDEIEWTDQVAMLASRPVQGADPLAILATSTGQREPLQQDSLAASVTEKTTETPTENGLEISSDDPRYFDETSTGWGHGLDGRTRAILEAHMRSIAIEMGDESTLPNTLAGIANLYRQSGLDIETFADKLLGARAETQANTAAITKERGDSTTSRPRKNKMPVFLTNLKRELGIEPRPVASRVVRRIEQRRRTG